MAVPGNITSLVSAGSNRLIRDGAAPVLEAADLLQHFPELVPVPAEKLLQQPRAEHYRKRCCPRSVTWPGCSGAMRCIPTSWR